MFHPPAQGHLSFFLCTFSFTVPFHLHPFTALSHQWHYNGTVTILRNPFVDRTAEKTLLDGSVQISDAQIILLVFSPWLALNQGREHNSVETSCF